MMMMKRSHRVHSFITLNRLNQKLVEKTVKDQDQPGAQIQIYNLTLKTRPETFLRLISVGVSGRRP